MSMYQTVTKTNQKQSNASLILLLACNDLKKKSQMRAKIFGYIKRILYSYRDDLL